MAYPMGEADKGALRLDFDRRLMLQFRGSTITSDAGLLAYRELDDALSLTDTGADTLADARTGKNGRHRLAGLLRQSVFGRLAGYEDVNDAERLCRDPAMRWVVGERAITGFAASTSQMGRFETKWLCRPENLVALADLPAKVPLSATSVGDPIRVQKIPTKRSHSSTIIRFITSCGLVPYSGAACVSHRRGKRTTLRANEFKSFHS